MISPRTFILALFVLLIAPVLSAPIHIYNGGTESVQVRSSSSLGFKRDSPMLAVHARRRNPLLLADSNISGRSFADEELETGSIREPVKKARHENKKLVSRGFWSKITNAVKKVGSSIAKGVSKAASGIKNAVQRVGGAIKNTAQKVGGAIKNTAQKVGGAVKNTVQKVRGAVKNTVQKVGGAIKNVAKGVTTAAKKTVKWVKANGAKIAKVGFKAIAAATKLASHAVAFIPGVGKPVGEALSGISKASDFVSAKIPAKLSKGLEKTMNVLDKVENPLGTGAAGQILDTVLKRDMEEEGNIAKHEMEDAVLYERDIPELDARSFDEDEIEVRSFDDVYELQARAFDDSVELEARSWDFEDEE